jgi:transposase-like protein
MNPYSLDLRKKIVAAKERGMPTTEVARTFGVGLSSVKRYAARKARVPDAGGGGFGERLHRQSDAQSDGLEPKKDRWVRQNATSS